MTFSNGCSDYKILVVCGPSGSGKSTLLKRLFEEYPEKFGFSVSHTTRGPRAGEVDGVHYHFTTAEEIKGGVEKGLFLETACFSGNHYGTSLGAVRRVCECGKVCVLDIEIEGVKQVKGKRDLDPVLVFIRPPSLGELEKRLRSRGTETEDSLRRRLDAARREIAYGETPGNFDAVIVNDDLEKSYSAFRSFVVDRLKTKYAIDFGWDD